MMDERGFLQELWMTGDDDLDLHDCSRPDLAASLARWSELEPRRQGELRDHASRCSSCGPALEVLVSVDDWLDDRLLSTGGDDCPAAEDLYAFGRGPGAEALSDQRYAAVAAHVATCAHCELLVDSLERRPPSPLIVDPPAAEPQLAAPARPTSLRLVGALTAAAASVAAAFLLFSETRAGAPDISFPTAPVLRGEAVGQLFFPRERVLAAREGGLQSEILFEIDAPAGASAFTVYLERHEGGAFDRGQRIATLRSGEPVLALPPEDRAALGPGHYTWEAWAVVNGLDEPLGRRDFEVARDPATLAGIEQLESQDEPARSEGILELLHSTYPSDARAFARTLPASPAREAYLARAPGR